MLLLLCRLIVLVALVVMGGLVLSFVPPVATAAAFIRALRWLLRRMLLLMGLMLRLMGLMGLMLLLRCKVIGAA